ncbi:MAG: hypothetical protein JXA90_04435, partial [Planctomycetes bacterium]|nr:hypothetical protein [Planctomycetota bacterium]
LVLYGYVPGTIYGAGNADPDGSPAELFIESADGDAIINHADWMFYVSTPNNGALGLENLMDTTGIMLSLNDRPMVVTPEAAEIAPSLVDFWTDRPLSLKALSGQWFVEASLAEDPFRGTHADPVIVRDGNRGRVIPALQANAQADPKGAVAAEIITWLMDQVPTVETGPYFVRGDPDSSGVVNITDGIRILSYLFTGGLPLECPDAGDTDNDGALSITDAIKVFGYLFLGQGEPAAPAPSNPTYAASDCGVDTETTLGCGVEAVTCGGTGPQP